MCRNCMRVVTQWGELGWGQFFFFVCFGVGIADSCARRVWRNVSAGFPHWERRSESVACNLDCMGCAHESPSALHRFSMPSGTVGESASLDGGCNDLAEKKNMRFRPDGHGTMKAGFTIEMRCLACCMRRTVRRGAVFALCLHEKLGGGLRSSDVKKSRKPVAVAWRRMFETGTGTGTGNRPDAME